MTLNAYDISDAEMTVALANSPLFIVRKLLADPTVASIAKTEASAKLLDSINSTVTDDASTLRDHAVPYVCLIALSLKRDLVALREATLATPSPSFPWFNYILSYLIQTYRPVQEIVVRATTPTARNNFQSSSSTESFRV